ncbi:MAG: hypothetical protein A2Z42_05120 [Candidatus Woykebacteria bacterium RBG_19FT_COMBO_43_10]|uniref:NlpC/P60 domain-containing protein n=1 Tax=Candidatus Woykebacteria bacterium RBG_19FT_COMBO_43_10 TaxID=1802598 RepID=A0A1G1WJN2_9BACT|nr:MAG: hypothetical protein A2Z42_05120 [Candidatus Woykebacteria bacterium RBG_19FT_COMBO_43_10]
MTKEEKIQKIIKTARRYLNTPYKKAARFYEAPEVFNCSTFTKFIFEKVGKILPKKAISQATRGRKINPKNIKLGDLVFIRGRAGYYNSDFPDGVGHVAIFVGNNKVISAKGSFHRVVEENVKKYLDEDQLRTIRRVL